MEELMERYNNTTAAHVYAVGFTRDGRVWYVVLSWAELCGLCKPNRASSKRGGYAKVRVLVPAKLADQWVADGKAKDLAAAEELVDAKWNRGDMFEKLMVERVVGGSWQKNSTPYWVAGDFQLDGRETQAKLTGAELTNERAVAKAEASAA